MSGFVKKRFKHPLPGHIRPDVVEATLALVRFGIHSRSIRASFTLACSLGHTCASRRELGMKGVGEGQPAHGVAVAVCDGEEMMRKDAEGDDVHGGPNDSNILFTYKKISVIGLAGTGKREVLNEFNKDGMVLIDGMTGYFVCSNYFVGNINKGEKSGGARHKSASAMANLANKSVVFKVGEAECKAGVQGANQEMDVFLLEKASTKIWLVEEEEEEVRVLVAEPSTTANASALLSATPFAPLFLSALACHCSRSRSFERDDMTSLQRRSPPPPLRRRASHALRTQKRPP